MLAEIENQIESGDFGFHKWRWQQRLLYSRGICMLVLDKPKDTLSIAQQGFSLGRKVKNQKFTALNHELLGLALTKLRRIDEAFCQAPIISAGYK